MRKPARSHRLLVSPERWARLRALLGSGDQSAEEVERRFRMIYAARRRVIPKCFESVATALLRRRRLKLKHFRRESGEFVRTPKSAASAGMKTARDGRHAYRLHPQDGHERTIQQRPGQQG